MRYCKHMSSQESITGLQPTTEHSFRDYMNLNCQTIRFQMTSYESKSTKSFKIDDLNLTFLDVAKVPISDAAIFASFNFCELRYLNISNFKLLNDSGFVAIAEKNRGKFFANASCHFHFCKLPNSSIYFINEFFSFK